MAFLSSRIQILFWIFILILCGLSVNNILNPVVSEFARYPKEKSICQKYTKDYGPCLRKYDPVCGKDDVTYLNVCFFCWAYWNLYQGNVHINYYGHCKNRQT